MTNKTAKTMLSIPKWLWKYLGEEDLLTIDCSEWLKYKGLLYSHIPNEGKRTRTQAAKIKLMGVLPGFPDIIIMHPNKTYHGLFIELKVQYSTGKKNYASPAQKKMIERLNKNGYYATVCYNLKDFKTIVTNYLNDV